MVQPKTARLPVALATGQLGKRPLAHLLVYALHRKLSGTFELKDEGAESAHIVVLDGMVVRVSTSTPVVYLGHVLYEQGVIDALQMSASLAAVATTKRLHGQVLLASGAIDREQLADALRQQRLRKLQHTFTLSPGTAFSFYADVDVVGARPDDVEPMNPLPSIWRGIRAYAPWEHVRATMATIAGQSLGLVASLDRAGLDDRERAVAERLRASPATVSDMVIRGRMDPRAADLLAYFLVIAKLAAIVEPTALVKSDIADARPSERALPAAASFPSGEYVRNISFTMRAVTSGTHSLRIPSPMPGTVPLSTIPRILPHPWKGGSSSETDVRHAPISPPSQAFPHSASSEASACGYLSEAELQYSAGRRERALVLVQRALGIAPGLPRAVALLAYLEAIATTPGQDAYLQSLLKMIEAAMVKEEKCRRARFYRAEIRKRLGDHEGALRDLRAACRDDPDDIDANRELNAYERKVRQGAIILKSTRG